MLKLCSNAGLVSALTAFIEKNQISAVITKGKDFDICLLYEKEDEIINNLPKDVIIIANGDDSNLLLSLDGVKSTVITCGMSPFSTLTLSGIKDDCLAVCLQRAMTTLDGNVLCFQEIPVHCNADKDDPVQSLLFLALGLICGLNITKIKLEE